MRKGQTISLKSAEDFRSVIDALNDPAIVASAETALILHANARMNDIYGYQPDEVAGMTWGSFSSGTPPHSGEKADELILKAADAGPQVFEWPIKDKSGNLHWVEVNARSATITAGPVVVITTRDITDRKRIATELTATKDYLNKVFNSIHDAVFVHDIDGVVTDVNDTMLDMYRTTREDALGLRIIPDYTTPEGRPDLYVMWDRVMEGEDVFLECRGRRPRDGFEFDVEVFLTKLTLPEGNRVLATVRDISERKRVERELLSTKDYLGTVFNSIHDAVFVHDQDGRVVDVNDKMLELYRLNRDEAVGLRIHPDFTTPEGLPDLASVWREVMNGRDALVECKGRRPKDGYEFDAEVHLTKLTLPKADYVLANVRDVSVRKRIERQLQAEEQRSRALSESSPVGMVVIDGSSHFRFKYLNPQFSGFFGGDLADTPDLHAWLTRVYPNRTLRRDGVRRWMNTLKETGVNPPVPFVRKLRSRDGSARYFRFVPVLLRTGEILMTCWDITNNRVAEKRIKERNLVLEVLNEVMSSVSGSLRLSRILSDLERVFRGKLRIAAGGVFFDSEVGDTQPDEVWWGVPASDHSMLRSVALRLSGSSGALRKGGVALISRALGSSHYTDEMLKTHKWRSCLCISLASKGAMSGVIFLASKKGDAFSDDQISFYRALGQQIGVATQNAHLFEQVHRSHAEMRNLSFRLVRVQEEELRHVGRELHDEIGQLLTGLGLAIEMADRSTGERIPNLQEVKSLVNTITGVVRELSRKLRPSMLDDLGLLPTLPWLFERFSSHANIRVVFEHMLGDEKRFGTEIETAVYRIVQEALTNVARHAHVTEATVRLWSNEKVVGVQIEDFGEGFDLQSVIKAGNANGLNGIRERIVLLGGQFRIETHLGKGSRLTAEFPKHGSDE